MEPQTVDVEAIAKALNITARRVQQLVGEGMPREAHGRYVLGTCMAWYIRFLQKALEARAAGDGAGGVMGLTTERARLAREQADRIAIENEERRGDLASVSLMERRFAGAVVTAQALLLSIPVKEAPMLAPITDANVIQHRLTVAINDALVELAAFGSKPKARRVPRGARGGVSSDGEVRPAAASDGERMGGTEPPPQ